jgi:glycosyltransferase involved in cell wall biosynthesis
MRVAMVDPSLFTGRYDDSLCAALGEQAHEVSLLARPLRATDAIVPAGYVYRPRYFALSERSRGLLGDGMAFRGAKAAEYMADALAGPLGMLRTSDVVHVQWLPFARADGIWLSRLAKATQRPALVHTVHNAAAYHGDSGSQGRGYGALLARFDALVVHGEETRAALLAQGLDAARIAIIPHPPMRLARADTAMLAQVPDPQAPRLLFFGTIRPYKGFDLLIDAALRLWREGAVFELAVAGKPFMPVQALLDKVRAAGFAERLILDLDFLKEEKLDAHLQKADMIAFPYRHIDSSGAFLSAVQYAKPMICSRVGMFATLEETDVALHDAGDVAGLADAILSLVRNPARRAEQGACAAQLAARLGSWDQAARQTADVYAQALARRCAV